MHTSVSYIYERTQLNTKHHYHTHKFNPKLGLLLTIVVTILDDDDNVVEQHFYDVKEENDA